VGGEEGSWLQSGQEHMGQESALGRGRAWARGDYSATVLLLGSGPTSTWPHLPLSEATRERMLQTRTVPDLRVTVLTGQQEPWDPALWPCGLEQDPPLSGLPCLHFT
jgi:hypothetical protein